MSTMIQCVPKPNVVAASRRRPQQHKLNELEQSTAQKPPSNRQNVHRIIISSSRNNNSSSSSSSSNYNNSRQRGRRPMILDEVGHIHRHHLLDLRVVEGLNVLQRATVINRRLIFHGRTLPLSTLLLNGSS